MIRSFRAAMALLVLFVLSGTAWPARPASAAAVESYSVPAGGILRLAGGGWGHGRGMSQWGAYQAATEGRNHQEILAFYYPGTSLSRTDATQVRVLLAGDVGRDVIVRAVPGLAYSAAGAAPVSAAAAPEGCATPARRWRAVATSGGVAVEADCGSWVRVVPVGPGPVTFEVPGDVVGVQNGAVRRGYRGQIRAELVGRTSIRVTNVVAMEDYLRAVVPTEVSASWPEQALAAQAVAARSFAAHEAARRSGSPFDVYDGTRSQAYPGAVSYDARWIVTRRREQARTDAAIVATAGTLVVSAGTVALTQFSSSNGGATAATTLGYMRASVDEWDSRATPNPRRQWQVSISARSVQQRHQGIGRLTGVQVLARDGLGPWGGRITSLRLVGTRGTVLIKGDSAIRATFGVHSSLFTFA